MQKEITKEPICRGCGVELDETNITPSRIKKYDWICKSCKTFPERPADPIYKKARRMRSRANERGATPKMNCKAFELIAKAFFEAGGGDVCDVDHKIPIAAGGCNCPANLQVLTKQEHQAKSQADGAWIWLNSQVYGKTV